MAVLPDFEYDIFISYRHNDNRSGWVTEFVSALQEELAATIKEPLSIYFDRNPHDGLLETHNVDKSLEGKLKCLIFIPIISQTYCDTKSFAWQHEFVAFNKLAKEDLFGRDIKLNNGNVASRILPIKIHDLDSEDRSAIESEIGGVLRAIEFIYKEPGVNRSLKPIDHKSDNYNKTDYSNQLNKVANAIKEIIQRFVKPPSDASAWSQKVKVHPITVSGISKSIAILPFVNMSSEADQEYFSDGLTEEIITDLSKVNELLVISRSSIMTYKGTRKIMKEIANEMNVHYVLEGSVRKSGNNLRITAQLIDALSDVHVWAEKYSGTVEDIFEIQENVSRAIVAALKIKLTGEEDKKIAERPIDNYLAYEGYLKAKGELLKWTAEGFDLAKKYIENSLEIVGANAQLYGGMAYVYFSYVFMGIRADENLIFAQDYVKKAFEIDPESVEGNMVLGQIFMAGMGKPKESIPYFKKAIKARPGEYDALLWLGACYTYLGDLKNARQIAERVVKIDPLNPLSYWMLAYISYCEGDFESAHVKMSKAFSMDSNNPVIIFFVAMINICRNHLEEARDFVEKKANDGTNIFEQMVVMLKFALRNDSDKLKTLFTTEFQKAAKRDGQYSHIACQICAIAGLNKEAMDWLEISVNLEFINYPFFMEHDPSMKNIRNEHRFQKLMEQVRREWLEFKA